MGMTENYSPLNNMDKNSVQEIPMDTIAEFVRASTEQSEIPVDEKQLKEIRIQNVRASSSTDECEIHDEKQLQGVRINGAMIGLAVGLAVAYLFVGRKSDSKSAGSVPQRTFMSDICFECIKRRNLWMPAHK